MTEQEKLLKKAGATLVKVAKHKVYLLDGVKFTIHHGNKPNPQEIFTVKKLLRRLRKLS